LNAVRRVKTGICLTKVERDVNSPIEFRTSRSTQRRPYVLDNVDVIGVSSQEELHPYQGFISLKSRGVSMNLKLFRNTRGSREAYWKGLLRQNVIGLISPD